jgi:IS30 family transposase
LVAANLALRNRLIRDLVGSGRCSVTEIGRHLGLHYSTVSRIGAAKRGVPSG